MNINSINSNQNFNGTWLRLPARTEIKVVPFLEKLGIYRVTEDVYYPAAKETEQEIAKAMCKPPYADAGNKIKQLGRSLEFMENRVSRGPRIAQ